MQRESDHQIEQHHLRAQLGSPSQKVLEHQAPPDDYACTAHAQLQRVFVHVAGTQAVLSSDAVRLRIEEQGETRQLTSYLSEIEEMQPSLRYAVTKKEVARRALLRRIEEGASRLKVLTAEGRSEDAQDALDKLAAEIAAERGTADNRYARSKDLISAATQQFLADDEVPRVRIEKLDGFLAELAPGSLAVIGGIPGAGKSSLMLHIANEMLKVGIRPGIISQEDPRSTWGARLIAQQTGVDLPGIHAERRAPNDIEKAKVSRFVATVGERDDHWMIANSGWHDEAVRSMRQLVANHGCQVVFLDYLQLLRHKEHSRRNENQALDVIVSDLKAEARRLGVPLVLASQLRRLDSKPGRLAEPTMSDLRGSGAIEQQAEAILLLWKETNDQDAPAFGKVEKLKNSANRPRFEIRRNPAGAITALYDIPLPPSRDEKIRSWADVG